MKRLHGAACCLAAPLPDDYAAAAGLPGADGLLEQIGPVLLRATLVTHLRHRPIAADVRFAQAYLTA
jgi:hypothetical protein